MKKIVHIISVLGFLLSLPVHAQTVLDLETGAVFTGYNDVRIPGAGGTPFSLKDDLDSKSTFFYRLRLDHTINSRHTFSLLYAPLQTKSEGSINRDLLFEGVTFSANEVLESTYRFNSYRLTYRYDFIKKSTVELGFGFTGKIRDAEITLSSYDLSSSKSNVGFVPLVNFRLLWNLDDQTGLLLYGDALAAPQGRAEDVLIAFTRQLSDQVGVRVGYRILEGGAENDEVYNFSLFNYASIGFKYTF